MRADDEWIERKKLIVEDALREYADAVEAAKQWHAEWKRRRLYGARHDDPSPNYDTLEEKRMDQDEVPF
jgi:hypothetical protein